MSTRSFSFSGGDSGQWRVKYNEYRPYDALGRIPPAMYVRNLKLENSSLEL